MAEMRGDVGVRIDPLGQGHLAEVVRSIAEQVAGCGGRALVVGGAVRDAFLAVGSDQVPPVKDIDLEVFGVAAEALVDIVGAHGVVTTTGASFAVFKVAGLDLDVSLPRTERKTGAGHRGFLVNADPSLTPARAALRRDFTVNAVSWDPLSGEVVDPVGGVDDLRRGVLRHVSPAFAEDPLRVLRAAQFVSRFELTVDAGTVGLCHELRAEAVHLARERVAEEWEKLLRGRSPGRGVRFLDECGWLDSMHPLPDLRDPSSAGGSSDLDLTIAALDRWAATRVTVDLDPNGVTACGLAVLCHRLDGAGAEPLGSLHRRLIPKSQVLLSQLTHKDAVRSEAVMLIQHHGLALGAGHVEDLPAAVRRLSHRTGGRLAKLLLVEAAIHGQNGSDDVALGRARDVADELGVLHRAPIPLLSGHDLIAVGYTPGPTLGAALREVFEAQLDGDVTTTQEALAFGSGARRHTVAGTRP